MCISPFARNVAGWPAALCSNMSFPHIEPWALQRRTGWFVEVGQIGQVITSLEHGRIHQGRQQGVVSGLQRLGRYLNGFGLHITQRKLAGRRGLGKEGGGGEGLPRHSRA